MHNRALRWNDLHEDHVRNRLSEVDPFPGRIATSSPWEDHGDPEIELWGARAQSSLQNESPLESRDRAEFIRLRLIMLLEAAEALPFPVVGIKDSSGDPARLERYLAMLPVYQGQQRQFVEGYQRGMRGTIGIIGHVSALPNEFYAPTCSDVRRKEIATAINDLSKVVKQGGAEVAAYKYLLSLMGVTGDTVASNEPARELTPEQRDLIRTSNTELVRQGRCRTA